MQDFMNLGISKIYADQLREQGITQPTPIQERVIPLIKAGSDVIAQAQTGTGKTLAFVLPILEQINVEAVSPQALVITPTRELALQITAELEKLTADVEGIEILAVYGGQDVERQLKKLKQKVQFVVGTPGRLLDHIARKTIDLSQLDFLVLDEADQMLHIGFLDEVEKIIRETPKRRQTLLFSATIPAEIRKLANTYMLDPEYIQVAKIQGPAENVNQIAIHTTDRAKQNTLVELIETHRPFLAVIFCRTKRRVTKLYDALKARGFLCDELHGDLSQAKRERVMKDFREAKIQLLVATDVAARGLDVEGVTHVYNYDIPLDAESYVHRIGRTGRAGMKGLAITLYSAKDRPLLDEIQSELNIKITKKNFGNRDDEEQKEHSEKQRKANDKSNRNSKQKAVQAAGRKDRDRKEKDRPQKATGNGRRHQEGKPRRKGRR